jgi:HPt (histidine-containing phosphotransfer) domain-containing protein
MSEKNIVSVDKDLEEIIPSFLENRKKDLTLLDQAIEQNDFAAIEVIGHKLAGNAGSYGFPDLGEIGCSIELQAEKKNSDTLRELIASYKSYMETLEIKYE